MPLNYFNLSQIFHSFRLQKKLPHQKTVNLFYKLITNITHTHNQYLQLTTSCSKLAYSHSTKYVEIISNSNVSVLKTQLPLQQLSNNGPCGQIFNVVGRVRQMVAYFRPFKDNMH